MSLRIQAYQSGLLHAAAMLLLCAASGPASAQGILEQIFEFGSPKPAAIDPRLARARAVDSRAVFTAPSPKAGSDTDLGDRAGGTYRTLCVRMCDGYYVPISFATTRRNFYQDQVKCRATCGDDAHLFYHRNPGSTVDDAIDLNGRVYGRLPNAFRYRKSLVEGCTCRPPPWSDAELARHRSYADAQAPSATAAAATAVIVAAAEPPSPPLVGAEQTDATVAAAGTKPAAAAAAAVVQHPIKPRVPRKLAAHAPTLPNNAAPAATGGLFGFGAPPSMGLGGQPKYTWPGDPPARRQ